MGRCAAHPAYATTARPKTRQPCQMGPALLPAPFSPDCTCAGKVPRLPASECAGNTSRHSGCDTRKTGPQTALGDSGTERAGRSDAFPSAPTFLHRGVLRIVMLVASDPAGFGQRRCATFPGPSLVPSARRPPAPAPSPHGASVVLVGRQPFGHASADQPQVRWRVLATDGLACPVPSGGG